jgi:soluble lytic murein transglycosylase
VAHVSSATPRISRRASRARTRRRRLVALAVAAVLAAGVAAVVTGLGPLGEAVREITLPLHHDDIIRQQAADKDLDPALIAAVIYEESRFRDQTSHAGARGLMQITPETADFIARRSGGNRFVQEDLASPQINIAYGSYFLRYLIDH